MELRAALIVRYFCVNLPFWSIKYLKIIALGFASSITLDTFAVQNFAQVYKKNYKCLPFSNL